MSRLGKRPIEIPQGVEIQIQGSDVTIKGPKGTINHRLPAGFSATQKEGVLVIAPVEITENNKRLWGLHRMLVANAVEGVRVGHRKVLDIVGVGYKAEVAGKGIKLTVGYSHSVFIAERDGITMKVESPTRILVEGVDKQLVGQVAAEIRAVRLPEPYKGKGIKYADERIRRKAGKAAVK